MSVVGAALPPGALIVGVGFVVSGLGAYVFLAVASRVLSPIEYAPLASLWSMVFMVWPGAFTVLERETARRLSAEGTAKRTAEPFQQVLRFAILELAAFMVVLVLARGYLSQNAFGGSRWLDVDLALAGPAIAVQYVTWGVLAGNRRFRAYSALGAAEGLGRVALAAILVVFGVRSAAPYGLVVAVAPALAVVSVLPSVRGCRLTAPGFQAQYSTSQMVLLLGSFLALATLINVGPLLVRLIAPHDRPVLTGRFLSALVVVRVPLFLFNAAATALMPALSSSASQERWTDFRHALTRLVSLIGAIAGVSLPLALFLGPNLMRLIFGAKYVLDGPSLTFLAATSCLLILGTTQSVALTAVGAVRRLFAAWVGGVLVLALCCLLPLQVVPRVEIALLLGSLVPNLVMAHSLYWSFRYATTDGNELPVTTR